MKKLLFTVGLMLGAVGFARAYSFGDLKNDIVEQTHWTILESATPGYFYDLKDGQSHGGFVSKISEYRFITLDAGWVTPFDPNLNGSVVLGGSIHIDKLVRLIAPESTESLVQRFVPASAMGFWEKVTIGSYIAHDVDYSDFQYGLYSGLEFKF